MPIQEKINYDEVIERYPWLLENDHKCIISPDADGMLSGLFMSHYLNWEIVGYYDNGKNLILKKGLKAEDCIFLDTEIHRTNIRSIGHHISFFRNDNIETELENFKNCFNPNNLRSRTLKYKFGQKYPMGTIHLLLCIVGQKLTIKYLDKSFFVILQADGTINRFLDKYSENLNDWMHYLGITNEENSLNKIIQKDVRLIDLNEEYVNYVRKFVKAKKDKIPISEKGILKNESFNPEFTKFSENCAKAALDYLKFLSEQTSWILKPDKWLLDDFVLYKFTKMTRRPGVRTYHDALQSNFLSIAITASDKMDYTIEDPDKLP